MKLRYKILLSIVGVAALAIFVFGLYLSHDSPCGVAPAAPAGAMLMRAAMYRCYGAPAVVKIENVVRPTPKDDELLVRVHAASVNPLDWHYLSGKPYIVRMDAGFGAPTDPRLGVDFAGTVEAVGRNVTRYKTGDEVFGGHTGAFAEYVTVRESRGVAIKPGNVSFEEAAAVPIAGLTALQSLRDKGHVHAGEKVLINGASGGVGTFAVQIAKAYGAEVTAVCSTRNLELVRSLGADHVIDYTREDFTRSGQRYDLILDNVGTHSFSDYRRAMTPNGTFVIIGGLNTGSMLGALTAPIKAFLMAPFISQHFSMILAEFNHQDVATLADLMQAGKVKPAIDRRYTLDEVPQAIAYLEQGHARAKVIIDVP